MWTAEIVNAYAAAALGKGWRAGPGGARVSWAGGAILIRAMWETTADSTDAISWTKADHFKDHPTRPAIEFDRGKTGEHARIAISRKLAATIRTNGSLFVVCDPCGRPYDGFKDDRRLRGHLITLREHAIKAGSPRMIFDHLRHSALTHAEETGSSPEDIRHLAQHKSAKTTRSHYLQQSAKKVEAIQKARGLID